MAENEKTGCGSWLVLLIVVGIIFNSAQKCSTKHHKRQHLILPKTGFFERIPSKDPDIYFQTFFNQEDGNFAFFWESGRIADMNVVIRNGNDLYDHTGNFVGYIIVNKDGSFDIKGSSLVGGHYVGMYGEEMSYEGKKSVKRKKKEESVVEDSDIDAEDVFLEVFYRDFPYVYENQKTIADRNGFVFLAADNKMGLSDRSGRTLIAPSFDCLELTEDGKNALVIQKDCQGLYSTDGNEILPAEFSSISSLRGESTTDGLGDYGDFVAGMDTDPYLYVKKDGKVGVADKKGRFICDLKYTRIVWPDSPDKGVWFCVREDGLDIFNYHSQVSLQVDCEECLPSMDSYCSIRRNGKWGIVNCDGEVIVDTIYDEIPTQGERTMYCLTDNGNTDLAVIKDGKYGIIDFKGNVILPFEYDYIDTCPVNGSRKLFVGKKDEWVFEGKWGLYKEGRIVSPCTYATQNEVNEMIWNQL